MFMYSTELIFLEIFMLCAMHVINAIVCMPLTSLMSLPLFLNNVTLDAR